MNTQAVKELLEALYEDASARQQRLEKKVVHRETPLPADFSEQAVELQNQETMEQLMQQTSEELNNIKLAMERLSNETYYQCTDCDGPINPERLAALPTTTYCAECAQSH